MTSSFNTLGLMPELVQTVTELGYITPTPIQSAAIPSLLNGHDVMGQAQTGTGKTAAFTMPVLQNLESDGLQALILTPTRELAIQVSEAVYRYGNKLGVRVLPIYGGQPYARQIRRLEKGVHVVVGTPGRTLDLIRQRALDLRNIRFLVLDEADEMLKMGFIEDIEAILSATPDTRQTALFSATFPEAIQRLAEKYTRDAKMIAIESQEETVENIAQRYYVVRESEKLAALGRLLEVENLRHTLIFARTKAGASDLSEELIARGFPAVAIHGDLPQIERERILRQFRSGQLTILVATDVVARGVDIPEVSHVINFDIPQLPIEYVHRIGRTGRAGRDGDAITLITPRQRRQLRLIEDYTRKQITKAQLPSREEVLERRHKQFMNHFIEQINTGFSDETISLLEQLIEQEYSAMHVAAAALELLRAEEIQRPLEDIQLVKEHQDRRERDRGERPARRNRDKFGFEPGMVRLCMDIGRSNGVKPGEIVSSIAGGANIPGQSIGAIDIQQNQTFLDIKEGDVETVLRAMKNGKIRGRAMHLTRANNASPRRRGSSNRRQQRMHRAG